MKLTSLALLEQDVAVIYIDTSNYINVENMSLVLKVSISKIYDLFIIELYFNYCRCIEKINNSKWGVGETTSSQDFWLGRINNFFVNSSFIALE